jgi:hypothetical protein
MDLNQLKHQLQAMSQGSDATFAGAANFILQVIEQTQNGQMSPSETVETLQDVQRQMAVVEAEHQLASKEQMNMIINGLISIAGAV